MSKIHDYSQPGVGLAHGSILRNYADKVAAARKLEMDQRAQEIAKLTNALHEVGCLLLGMADKGFVVARTPSKAELRLAAEIINAALLPVEVAR